VKRDFFVLLALYEHILGGLTVLHQINE